MSGARIVDAHLHLWDRAANEYPWISPALGPLDDDFSAAEARAELDAAGIDRAVLVQAADSLGETRWMLDQAAANPWIAGVVGWIPLDDEPAAAAALESLDDSAALRGVRHLVHDDPRDEFLALPAVRASLGRAAAAGLAFDVPDAWPRHLERAGELAGAIPALTVVIDHLGKPPVGEDRAAWLRALGEVAARPNTVAKWSGLRIPGLEFSASGLRPIWDAALEAFGPDRLAYGGDWPMTVPHGGYQATWAVMSELIGELSPSEQDAVLAGTAERTYRLTSPMSTAKSAVESRSVSENLG